MPLELTLNRQRSDALAISRDFASDSPWLHRRRRGCQDLSDAFVQ